MERDRGGGAHRAALPAADPPATAQRFADLGDIGGLDVLSEQAGHVDGVQLHGHHFLDLGVGGHAS
ncbi:MULTISPECIES: hypothetical protein [Streptomyces]|uniref:hypothetical protein n=1 Tax=Streptomyces TaxID=1883 RepID=UPI0035E1E978